MTNLLGDIAVSLSSPLEKRLFAEYGAIFVTAAAPPPTIIFANTDEVEAFQASLSVDHALFGEHEITLQKEALAALIAAASDRARAGGSITARAADAGARSYQDTIRLWSRNVDRGIEHWGSLGRIAAERALVIRELTPVDQVAHILSLEDEEHLFFGTFFDKSILYSVAAPGASQHLSLLAFDLAEYEDEQAEKALAARGWHRTVPNDLPHFTYLGHQPQALFALGLKQITRDYGERVYDFWIPDLDRLAPGEV